MARGNPKDRTRSGRHAGWKPAFRRAVSRIAAVEPSPWLPAMGPPCEKGERPSGAQERLFPRPAEALILEQSFPTAEAVH